MSHDIGKESEQTEFAEVLLTKRFWLEIRWSFPPRIKKYSFVCYDTSYPCEKLITFWQFVKAIVDGKLSYFVYYGTAQRQCCLTCFLSSM